MDIQNNEIKQVVKEKYGQIAQQSAQGNRATCCGAGPCSIATANIMTEDYSSQNGYVPDADLGLGCGIPTEFAKIKKGDTVVDLGSGAGNDCFVARYVTGEEGKVIGVDFAEAMIQKAQGSTEKLGYINVEFRCGDIENVPIEDKQADVVISNCVMNLIPNKRKAFAEVFRILKPGGHFSISDIVLKGELPEHIRNEAEMYVGCVAGALQKKEYLDIIAESGFQVVSVQKEKRIEIPDDILAKYVSEEEIKTFKSGQTGIYSISVYAERPKQV